MSFDFDAAVVAPFRMQPGLRRLAPHARHLNPSAPGSRHQREKLAVLSAFAHEALAAREGFDAAPAVAALAARAAAEHPGHFAWNGGHAAALGVQVPADGRLVHEMRAGVFGLGDEIGRCLRALPPRWRLAGLLSLAFEEDFALLDGRDGTVPWLAVALPSHWAPEEKVGLHFRGVHAPVADNERLIAAGESLPLLVSGPAAHERFVWSLGTHPRLHAHPRRSWREPWPVGDPDAVAQAAWWRTERQTFLPLSGSACAPGALFTIGVQVRPLVQALAGPAQAQRLHDALASMSPAVLAYRGLAEARDDLLAWLARRARA
ncbi:MAG: heme-dependent oxidative N-demethylase subunit alpha family protein [Rubrivivax sp.]